MNFFSRRFILALSAFLFIVPAYAQNQPANPKPQKVEVTFLHLNDVYEISPKENGGGLAEVYALVKAERAKHKNTFFTLGGDLLSPSLMSGLTKGAQMIDLFNEMKLDMAALGNHEFDFGPDVLLERMKASKFTWLSSNIRTKDGKPFGNAKDLVVKEINGIKFGFFGLSTEESAEESSPGPDVQFNAIMDSAKDAVKQLKEQGADVIIAITHLYIAEDRALVKANPDIKLVLGGHDHDPITYYENGALIFKTGSDAKFLGAVDLQVTKTESDRGPRIDIYPSWRLVSTKGVKPEAKLAAKVTGYNDKLDAELDVAIATTETEIDSRRSSVRTGEATMGNLIAEASLEASGADVALANGGGIRGDKLYEAGTKLTKKDILSELPFGNVMVMIELSGKDLLAALENGVSRLEDKAGRFPQVAGMRFTFDPKKPVGERVSDVKIGDANLDLDKNYKVATDDYKLGGGDGYSSLKNGKVLISPAGGPIMANVVIDYLVKKGKIAPALDGRIKIAE